MRLSLFPARLSNFRGSLQYDIRTEVSIEIPVTCYTMKEFEIAHNVTVVRLVTHFRDIWDKTPRSIVTNLDLDTVNSFIMITRKVTGSI
jgi:hypothetical protein